MRGLAMIGSTLAVVGLLGGPAQAQTQEPLVQAALLLDVVKQDAGIRDVDGVAVVTRLSRRLRLFLWTVNIDDADDPDDPNLADFPAGTELGIFNRAELAPECTNPVGTVILAAPGSGFAAFTRRGNPEAVVDICAEDEFGILTQILSGDFQAVIRREGLRAADDLAE